MKASPMVSIHSCHLIPDNDIFQPLFRDTIVSNPPRADSIIRRPLSWF